MSSGYTVDNTLSTVLGSPVNTGGTATVSALIGDLGNSSLAVRTPVFKQFTTTLNVNNTTGSITLATLSANGGVRVLSMVGTVTTVLSSNITAAHLRLNDSTNTPAITLATGTTLSSAAVGSRLQKTGLAAAALVFTDAAQCRVVEHATSGLAPDVPFDLIAKSATTTTIEFRYTTTNIPSSGVIVWDVLYYPINGGSLS